MKWLVLLLGALTNAVVVAIPSTGLSVLMPQISADLHLNLVQAGVIWGVNAVPLILSSLFAGNVVDRFGPKRVMLVTIIVVAIAGVFRGLATGYYFFLVAVLAASLFGPVSTICNLKNARIWFTNRQLGFASGILSLGMAVGFFVSAMVSSTVLSPWLGGWRNVFFFFSGILLLFLVPWIFVPAHPAGAMPQAEGPHPSLSASIRHVAGMSNIWLLGIGALGIGGGIQGVIGYLPLYLNGLQWPDASAAGVVGVFNAASMLCVLPITLLSDRLSSRKMITIGTALLTAIGTGMLIFARGSWIWAAAVVAGLLRDGFMALFLAMSIELSGADHKYAGTATGFALLIYGVGTLISPPIGNSLADLGGAIPFAFWTVLILAGCVLISFTREERVRVRKEEELVANV